MDYLWPAIWLLCLVIGCAWLVGVRTMRGWPILAPRPPDALFMETWASGQVGPGRLASFFGSWKNCLLIAVTPRTVEVWAHFPFCLCHPQFFSRIEGSIPIERIRAVTRDSRLWFYNHVRLEVEGPSGEHSRLLLVLWRSEEFIQAVDQARSHLSPRPAQR